jgi:hypothetical protein
MIGIPEEITPIFIFSLPRSGSTLLQRILAAHDSITTASEPWILLPLIYSLRDRGIYTEYRQTAAMAAIQDFINLMPNGIDDYYEELRTFTTRLYARTTNEPVNYFVDKTPRYYLIIDDIVELFPNGKFIFMWRNPLAIISSLIESFSKGKWELYRFQVDLFTGLENLISSSEKYLDRCYFLRYEDLITNPETHINEVFDYLDLAPDSKTISNFSNVQLLGSKGDPIGTIKYKNISSEPLDKWKKSLMNPYRKLWCRQYLTWIGEDRLFKMGYEKEILMNELTLIPFTIKYLFSDLYHWVFGIGFRLFEPRITKHKIQNFPNWYRINTHT